METIYENIPLAPLTSFQAGGKARYYLAPESIHELRQGLSWAEDNRQPVFVFGMGTNLVFADAGFNGLIIHTRSLETGVEWSGSCVRCGAGVLLHDIVEQAVDRGLAGMEKLAGIPGSIGGGVYINAGAFGQELCQVVSRVKSSARDGAMVERSAEQCAFGYRSSVFCSMEEIIVAATLKLKPGDSKTLSRDLRDILQRRSEKQPLHLPSAGSVFKRPQGSFAGSLIQEAGLKGYRLGGAQVSEKHANFIVNAGGASGQDIYDLSEYIIGRVRENSGIILQKEVRFIGEFLPWPR
ncbi:UDP-N-acetylmuramate dehydrogenase [Fibrobacterota bacterium]